MRQKTNKNSLIQKVVLSATALSVLFATTPAVSAIPYRNAYEGMDVVNSRTNELNLEYLAQIQLIIDSRRINVSDYVPYTEINPDDSSELVGRRILNKTIETFLNSENVAKSKIVQGAQAANSAVNTSLNHNGHKFNFRFRALEAKSEFSYEGYVKAVLSYNVKNSEARLEVSKTFQKQTYAYTHVSDSNGMSRDMVGVRWSF